MSQKQKSEVKKDFIAGFKAGALVSGIILAIMLLIVWILL
jgi:hypothetical protein